VTDFPVTIFHNPACGTSRRTLEIVRAAGYKPEVVEYLKTGWTRPQLERLLAAMSARPRDILRERGAPAEALALLGPEASDAALLDAMTVHPALVQRPIVVTPKGARVTRPPESVLICWRGARSPEPRKPASAPLHPP
jgi:arsenate reductase